MGRWIKRKADEHRCDKPHHKSDAPEAHIGDQWECDCGSVYEITGFDTGMQWDPYPTVIRWKFVDKHAPRATSNTPAALRDEDTYYGPYGFGRQDR